MRILITGILVFVIWSIFSIWLYVSKIRPAMEDAPVAMQEVPKTEPIVQADTVNLMPMIELPTVMVFNFDFDDAKFQPSPNEEAIQDFKDWVLKNDTFKISIVGHTDSKGSEEYNLKLGMQRAISTKNYFSNQGIEPERIETYSEGESQPIEDQSTEEGRAKNRRSVVTVKN